MANSIAAALKSATQTLQAKGASSARLDAELLLCETLEKPRTYLYSWSDKQLTQAEGAQYNQLIQRRAQGEPLAYILGYKEFWSLRLKVTPDTLIPRPETELLIDLALQRLPKNIPATAADLGTGSGAIALAIASERPLTNLLAIDVSPQALVIARENALTLGIANVEFSQGSWLQPLEGQPPLDLIVSNPPYVAERDPHLEKDGLPWEPIQALTAGEDGLRDIKLIANSAIAHLKPGAHLIIEHGYNQGDAVKKHLNLAGFRSSITVPDLEGRDRVSIGETPPA